MTYNVFGGTLNLAQSINHCDYPWSKSLGKPLRLHPCCSVFITARRYATISAEVDK